MSRPPSSSPRSFAASSLKGGKSFSLNTFYTRSSSAGHDGARPPTSPRDGVKPRSYLSNLPMDPVSPTAAKTPTSLPPRQFHSLQGLFRPRNPNDQQRPHSAREALLSPSARTASQPYGSSVVERTAQPSSARPPTAPTLFSAGSHSSLNTSSFSLNSPAGGGNTIPIALTSPRGASARSQAFHKGVVNNLGGVLRHQRTGKGNTAPSSSESQPPPTRVRGSTPQRRGSDLNESVSSNGGGGTSSAQHTPSRPAEQRNSFTRAHGGGGGAFSQTPPPPSIFSASNATPPLSEVDRTTPTPEGSHREHRAFLVSQMRSEWAQQRWSATSREKRREMTRRVQQSQESSVSEDQIGPDWSEPPVVSRNGSSFRTNFSDVNVQKQQSAEAFLTRAVEEDEAVARGIVCGAQSDGFEAILRTATMFISRSLLGAAQTNSSATPVSAPECRSAQVRREQIAALYLMRQEGNARYKAQNYTAAHALYSRVIDGVASCAHVSSAEERESLRELHALALLNRCAASLALLNYDACVTDGLTIVRLSSDCARGADQPPPLSVPLRAKAWLRVAKAHAMLEGYTRAEEAYDSALQLIQSDRNSTDADATKALDRQAKREKASLSLIKQIRSALNDKKFREALRLLDRDSGASVNAFSEDAPLMLCWLEAEVHVRPNHARTEGARYVSALLSVAEKSELSIGSSSSVHRRPASAATITHNSLLLSNLTLHICDALVALGRAAFFSGPLYANIATQKLAMCVSLRHDHRGAMALRKQMEAYERMSSAATALTSSGKYTAALEQLTSLLALAQSFSGALTASVAMARAEIFSQKMNNTPSAVSDTTLAIESDPSNARAFAARSRLFQGMGDYGRALQDLTMASSLASANSPSGCNPYADDLAVLREQCREESEPFDFGLGRDSRRYRGERPGTSGAGESTSDARNARRDRKTQSARPSRRCPYRVIGLTAASSIAEVRQAYKRLVLTCHPDKLVNASDEVKAAKETLFKEITKAYTEITEGVTSTPPPSYDDSD